MRRKNTERLRVGDIIEKGYNRDGDLVIRDFAINSEQDIERLQDMGVHDTLVDPVDGSPELDDRHDRSVDAAEWVLDEEIEGLDEALPRTRMLYEKTLERLCSFFDRTNQEQYDREGLARLIASIDAFHQHVKESRASVSLLTQVRNYDEVTYHHCLHAGLLALLYGEQVGYDDTQTRQLATAGLLHDIGKMRIPGEILQKPEALDNSEWEQVKDHPDEGAKLLQHFDLAPSIYRVVYEHHTLPGEGYPENDGEPHEFSRIISVIDSYEAMVAYRPYKGPFSTLQAYRALQKEFGDNQQTRAILYRLIRSLGLYPVGTFTQLSGGEYAFVCANHPDTPQRPTVLLLTDERGNVLPSPKTLNLQRIERTPTMVNGTIYDYETVVERVFSFEDTPITREQFEQCIDKKR